MRRRRHLTPIGPALATAIHHRLAAEHGGPAGVRDEAALADALSAVKVASDPFAAAAADYAAEIVARRPFVGGNQRAALAVCRTFLAANQIESTADRVALVIAVRQLSAGTITRAGFADVLADRKPSAGATAGPTPVRRSAMDYTCSRCGSTVAEPGDIHSTGRLYFRPANAKFLTLKTGDIGVRANACTQCGHVDLVADVGKLDKLTRRAEPV